jgi:hypothetical protein
MAQKLKDIVFAIRLLFTIIEFQSIYYKYTKSLATYTKLIVKILNYIKLRK